MAETLGNERQAKRELLDVKVNEISLVDRPANEEEFAIIKRDDNSPADTAPPSPEPAKKEGGDMPVHEGLAKEKLAGIAALAGEIAAGLGSLDTKTLQEKTGKLWSLVCSLDNAVAPLSKRFDEATTSNDTGKALDVIQEALTDINKRKGKMAENPDKKAEDGKKPEDYGYPEAGKGGKGSAKRFTAERVDKLVSALSTIKSVLEEVGIKSLTDALATAKAESEDKVSKSLGDMGVAEPMPPPAPDKVTEELAALRKQVEELGKVGVSKSVTTDPPPNPAKKNVWEGLPLKL